jgi:hypothetical protein
MNTNKRSELTHRSELTQKVKNTRVANKGHYYQRSEVDDDVDEASSSMPVSTLSVPLYHSPPDTPMSTIMEPMADEIPPPPPPPPPLPEEQAIEYYEQQSIEYEHPREDQPQSLQSELPKNNSNSSKRVLEKSISGLKTLKSMAGSSMTTLLQSSGTGGGGDGGSSGGGGGGKNNGLIISPTDRMKAMLFVNNSSSKRDGKSSDNNGGIPPPPPATTTTPSSPSSADDILRDLTNGVSSSNDEGGRGEPRPHSGNSLENYVLPTILRMDMMDNTTTNHHQGGGMEVIKVSKVCPIYFCLFVLFLQYILLKPLYSQPVFIIIIRMGNNNLVNLQLLQIIVPCTLPVINHRDVLKVC